MWATIIDKFQCCLNPNNKSSCNKSQENKEVNLDTLQEKVRK